MTTVNQEIWIEKLPQIMLFQLQRVQYDKKTELGIKINDKFEFPKDFYADRYLYSNKEITKQLRERECVLKDKIRQLKASIESYENYKSKQQNLVATLGSTIEFLGDQLLTANQEPVPVNSTVTHFDPTHTTNMDREMQIRTKAAIELMKGYYDTTRKQLITMKQNLADIKKDIKDMYDRPQLRKHQYLLHSILMHSGNADSGHYFAFIYD